MNTFFKQSKKAIVTLLFVTGAITAQEKVSDAELGNFAKAVTSIQSINMEAQASMKEVVDQSGFELDRFNEIYQAIVSENTEVLDALTEEESKNFESIMGRFEAMQTVFQKQMEEAVVNQNITLDRFDVIAEQMETNTDLQMRLQAMMQQ